MENMRLSSFSFLKMSKRIIVLTDERLQNTNSLLTFHFIFSSDKKTKNRKHG